MSKVTIIKQNLGPHHGNIQPTINFETAFKYISDNPDTEYRTTGNQVTFIAKATLAQKGRHRAQQVIIFRSQGKERARAYQCCWNHKTNCGKTHIDCYTQAVCQTLTAQSTRTGLLCAEFHQCPDRQLVG